MLQGCFYQYRNLPLCGMRADLGMKSMVLFTYLMHHFSLFRETHTFHRKWKLSHLTKLFIRSRFACLSSRIDDWQWLFWPVVEPGMSARRGRNDSQHSTTDARPMNHFWLYHNDMVNKTQASCPKKSWSKQIEE